jgi:hypothetical protein
MDVSGGLTTQLDTGSGDVGAVEQIRVRVLPDGRLARNDAARYLGCAPKTLAMWAMYGRGPPTVKVAGRVFYYRSDLDAFIRGEHHA